MHPHPPGREGGRAKLVGYADIIVFQFCLRQICCLLDVCQSLSSLTMHFVVKTFLMYVSTSVMCVEFIFRHLYTIFVLNGWFCFIACLSLFSLTFARDSESVYLYSGSSEECSTRST